jgi:putative membrane protein
MAVQVMAPDAAFVLRVADHDARRMEAARLAGTRALDPQVKAFAGRMVTDHTRTSAELMTFARARSIIVKSDPGVAQLVANTFAGMAGARFDVAYASLAVTDHEASIALFEEESRGGRDAELKAWASRTLPTLREHLRLARELQASVTGAP